MNEYREIKLDKGYTAIVDIGDYEELKRWKWYAKVAKPDRGGKVYAYRYQNANDKLITCSMHRHIMGAERGIEVDHIDGNSLNNQRSNLRFATRAQNCANARLYKNNTSGHKGVSWNNGRWFARIRVNKQLINLGSFKEKEPAISLYAEAAKKYFGEFARV